MTYTSSRLDSLTESIWTALCKAAMSNNPSRKVQGANLWMRISEKVSAWPEGVLRVLASMGILPRWWWVREGLLYLVDMAGVTWDDGDMDGIWEDHEERVRIGMLGGNDGDQDYRVGGEDGLEAGVNDGGSADE